MNGKSVKSSTCVVTNFDEKSEKLSDKTMNCYDVDDNDDEDNDDDDDTDIISDYIGHYGVWQFFWTLLLCLFQLPCTFHIFSLVFQAANRDFWCARPSHLETISPEMWRNLTQPNGSCSIYNLNYWTMSDTDFTTNLVIPENTGLIECKSFEFDGSLIGDTIISEWNLVCDQAKFVSVVEMCFLAGAAVGSILSGWISDRFGRRHTLMVFALIQTVVGTLLTFSKSLSLFMTLRFIIGFASMSVVVVSFVLVVELVSGKYRVVIGILNILPVAIAYLITAAISYITYHWRVMQLFISIPCFSLILIWYHLPESPRWLLAKGRIDELCIIIDKAAKVNRITLPPNYQKTLIPPPLTKSSNASILELFSKKYCRTTLLMIIIWFSLILLYFGLTLHLSNLGGNIYANTVIAGSVEAISILFSIIVVLKLGLRLNLFIYMLLAGSACIMVNFVPDGNVWMIITLAMIAKFCIGANNSLIPIFTAFQYKCVMRNLGVGAGNFAAGFALIIVPYLWLLEHVSTYLPMSIMGVFGLIGAAAIFLMKDKTSKKKVKTSNIINTTVCNINATETNKNGIDNNCFYNENH